MLLEGDRSKRHRPPGESMHLQSDPSLSTDPRTQLCTQPHAGNVDEVLVTAKNCVT